MEVEAWQTTRAVGLWERRLPARSGLPVGYSPLPSRNWHGGRSFSASSCGRTTLGFDSCDGLLNPRTLAGVPSEVRSGEHLTSDGLHCHHSWGFCDSEHDCLAFLQTPFLEGRIAERLSLSPGYAKPFLSWTLLRSSLPQRSARQNLPVVYCREWLA